MSFRHGNKILCLGQGDDSSYGKQVNISFSVTCRKLWLAKREVLLH